MFDIRIISDLHVEFYDTSEQLIERLESYFPKQSYDETLIVAGDVGTVYETNGDVSKKYIDILKYLRKKWKNKIILVPGNHEYYFATSVSQVNDTLSNLCTQNGIEFLNKEFLEIDGYFFVGCTLWTKMNSKTFNKMNPGHKTFVKNHEEVVELHRNHLDWLTKTLEKLKNRNVGNKIIVISHHLPSHTLVHSKYLTDNYIKTQSAYSTNLDYLIGKYNDNIKFWFCGHSHMSQYFMFGNTFLFLNPIGNPWEAGESEVYLETFDLDYDKNL